MITLYHAPRSRSSRIIWLLEELGAEYQIELVDIVRGDGSGQAAPDSYRVINPLKKVPAIKVYNEVVFESAAICLYLTDSHQRKALGPLPHGGDLLVVEDHGARVPPGLERGRERQAAHQLRRLPTSAACWATWPANS